MDANAAVGSIARVNFPKAVIEKGFPGMVVIKASPEMGFLVWLNGYGGDYSREVTVTKNMGDISISQSFETVGNFYFISVRDIVGRAFENVPLSEIDEDKGPYQLDMPTRRERLIAEPIREACRRLGVAKLWKHSGESIPDNPDLIVLNLTERGPINIEARC